MNILSAFLITLLARGEPQRRNLMMFVEHNLNVVNRNVTQRSLEHPVTRLLSTGYVCKRSRNNKKVHKEQTLEPGTQLLDLAI